ncbi:MAG: DUF4097 family beta strand repeat protein [Acidobacteriota bacterium]|nr:DUF4097 family beta strand repeat protein [Acidobacteriota bacterium]MDE3043202.1 DUF4097 family beta strand repeat protein [Acidobacteriota bacterium]MDE3106524.1 DUF4097 family beta strand repeat protein [Acidobacteriota bacterium]MDE3222612.1 DUF4097 family beta strand repeat protein [Acidobacteriota bacterium]
MSHDRGSSEERENATPSFATQRVERFRGQEPISAVVSTRSGNVTVCASSNGEISVTLGTNKANNAELLDHARVHYDEIRHTLEIDTLPHGPGRSGGGLRAAMRGEWFSGSSGDLDVIVTMPEGSDLQVATASGDTAVELSLGAVKVSSASGDVVALDTFDALDVRTASGDVRAGRVLSRLSFKTASGDLVVAQAATKTEIASASGDVEVTAAVPGKLAVNSASGDVLVHVTPGLAVDVAGNTLSGHLGSTIDLSSVGDDDGDDQVSFIKVNTVSGDIMIDRARS